MQLNYDFKLRNIDKTRENHASQMLKVKSQIKFDDILDEWAIENIASNIQNYGYYQYNTRIDGRWHDKTKQAVIKELKSLVNQYTRAYIQERLDGNGYPKSWDTAFYMVYFDKVNKLMKTMIVDGWV